MVIKYSEYETPLAGQYTSSSSYLTVTSCPSAANIPIIAVFHCGPFLWAVTDICALNINISVDQ